MFRFDESDPRFLTIYTGEGHAAPEDYHNWVSRWAAYLDRNQPFGVLLISEPHKHDEEDDESHRQHEAEITRITNNFRRDYRDRTSQVTTGYARVFTPEMVAEYWKSPEEWEQSREANNRYAQYSWGIPGDMFTSVDAAQKWLVEQTHRQSAQTKTNSPVVNGSASGVGLFYGSSTGITEYVAAEIQETWAKAGMQPVESINIGSIKDVARLLDFDCLILGISTWNIGQLQDDWEIVFPQFDKLDFTGKKVAVFGLGDQYGYTDNFLDAVGVLAEKLKERGADLVGFYYDEHYKFRESLAFIDGKFMGLGLDDINQPNLTTKRIESWVAQIIGEFELHPQSVSSAT